MRPLICKRADTNLGTGGFPGLLQTGVPSWQAQPPANKPETLSRMQAMLRKKINLSSMPEALETIAQSQERRNEAVGRH